MSEQVVIYPMQANSLALTRTCEIDGKRYLEKNRYRKLDELFKAEKENDSLIIGRGKFFFYVLTPDKKFN